MTFWDYCDHHPFLGFVLSAGFVHVCARALVAMTDALASALRVKWTHAPCECAGDDDESSAS